MAAQEIDPDDVAARLLTRRDELARRRAELVAQRRLEQDEADALAVVIRAVSEVRRARDASSSARLRQARRSFEEIMNDVEALQLAVARVGRRSIDLELPEQDPAHHRGRRATHAALLALGRLSEDLRTAARVEEITRDVPEEVRGEQG